MSWLTDPFTFGFMQRALVASLIVGVLCAVVGCYIVLRSMAFLGDALAHAILPGVAISFLVGGNLLIGALVAAVVVAVGISYVSRTGAVREDTAIGIFFAAALALGVVLISTMDGYAVDLTHVLFGNVLGVTVSDLWVTGGLALAVMMAVVVLYRRLLVVSFDPILGETLGLRTGLLRTGLYLMLALTIVVSLRTVGVALVAAMLVTPPATAYLLTRRLPSMMVVSALIGGASAVGGLYASYYLDVAPSGAMVLVATVLFLVVFLFAPAKGVVSRLLTGRSPPKGRSPR
jgi:ABC-type Mn2+/Zn2+ transport system permease subunit